jgi:hypothetical protein
MAGPEELLVRRNGIFGVAQAEKSVRYLETAAKIRRTARAPHLSHAQISVNEQRR